MGVTGSNIAGYLQLYSGREINVLDPQPEQIQIIDIAHALSQGSRYGGHCLRFYSVAEHCCLMFDKIPRLDVLLHDASEAYLVDVPRPVKRQLPQYLDLEEKLMVAIAKRFAFQYPFKDDVKRLDNAMLTDEREQNMAPYIGDKDIWGKMPERAGVTLQFWSPQQAELEFLRRFNSL